MINYKTVEKIVKSNIMVSSITGIIEEVNVEEIVDLILDSLPKLDKKEVKKLAIKLLVDKYSLAGYAEKDIDEIVNKICSLIPAGEVIAEGIVESDSTTCKSLRDFVSNIDGFTSLPIKENLKGKKVQIIIREVTDE